ncbi:MAG: neutral/alkaline non-lysosomal ceramidase N-terminal domain-containing protein [Fimbriimonadales bacterium]|nr:neutral/alkaline non-lysosomal ceramidase N-terminal domain-containing protein [Fimbriimonadales bacterium]
MRMQRQWLAGASRVDITPDIQKIRIQLGGYGARLNMPPTGVHDPIYARALALQAGDQLVVLVALDHLLVPASLTEAVLREANLRPEQLFMAASHTHCAPDSMGLNARARFALPGVGSFLPEFLQFTTERIVEAIRQARARLRPARLSVSAEALPNLNRNRRGAKITDPTMTVLRVDESARRRTLAALVIYAAHPTIYPHTMMQVSAEFPGVLQSRLEAALGEGVVALYMNGAQGDVSPVADEGKDDHERVRLYGEKLATHALRLLRNTKPLAPKLRTAQIRVSLPEARPHPQFYESAGREYKVPEALLNDLVKQLIPPTTPVSLMGLDSLALVGFPGEPITALGLEARQMGQQHGFRHVAPVALVNDWIGYILTREEYEKGGYEATVSFNGPDAGAAVMKAVREGFARL